MMCTVFERLILSHMVAHTYVCVCTSEASKTEDLPDEMPPGHHRCDPVGQMT